MKRSFTTLLVLALYLKLNDKKRGRQSSMSDDEASDIISIMLDVTEMCDDEIKTEEGILEMGIKYALDKKTHEEYSREQAEEYNSIYR